MSAESTTTTLNDVYYSAIISPMMMDYAHDWVVATQFLREYSLVGQASNAVDIWSLASDLGTVGAHGASYDAEFNASQANDLSNTALDTNKVTLTAAEYGVMRTITDNVLEDSIGGIDWTRIVLNDSVRILMLALEQDTTALLDDFSNVSGTSGSDLTVAQLLAAQVGVRTRGVRAPDGGVYVLADEQVLNVETELMSTSTSMAVYAGAADRLLGGPAPSANNGMSNGHVMSFRGYPVWASGVNPTTGADDTGAFFVHSTPSNDQMAALGIVWKRMFRLETDRDISLRATEYVATMRVGVGELLDAAGTSIITDAPT
jgi:hypothetical protein